MKLFITFLFFFIGYSAVDAQTTFNRRYSFGSDNCIISYVHTTDSCYYIAGLINDSINPIKSGLLFAKIDFNGDAIFSKKISSPLENMEYWKGSLPFTQDNNFLLSGYGHDSDSSYSIVTKIAPNGDIIWTKKFNNPINSNSFIVGWDVLEQSNKQILFTSTAYDTTIRRSSIWLQNLDSLGIRENSILFNRLPYSESAPNIYKDKYSNYYILASMEQNFLGSIHNILRAILPSGGVVWTYVHPEYCGTPNDVIRTLDTGYVIATSKVYNINPTTSVFSPYLYKLDKNRQLIWSRELPGYQSSVYSGIERVFEQPDSSLIAIGTNFISWDSVNYRNFNVCIIHKLSAGGDSLWGRQLYLLNQHGQDNLVRDARQTADGGFIICGETSGGLWVNEPQRGWLLKVDSMGCLTPGCHLLAAEAIATAEPQIQIYPNPAQDEAHVFMSLPRESTGYLVLYDALGRELRRQPFAGQEATFVLDISAYASGLYYVSIAVAGASPVVRQLVKM